MNAPAAEPTRAVQLLRFSVRALRIAASTVAVVALLKQQWFAAGVFSLAWLLIAAAPLLIPQLRPEPSGEGQPRTPDAQG
jgi:hypothetical protein